jgi:murein DD-endopeptidase MepM/ murein hydrolase activator NlpD
MSYDVDFKQKVRPGDSFELFFEAKQEADGNNKPGKLLYIAMTVQGQTTSYYRFRTSDGTVDFYNTRGSNSRKFLMKKPLKVGRFTSGFGYRVHPLLGIRRMHTGVDWGAPRGTPIMAAGSGTIEEAGLHGGYGRYIRIRHSNGYKTAYGHMHKIASGIKKGMKVRQGQLIGQVGSTGMSTGPHLHYEVLVNNRHTNPMKIRVPRGRQLSGRQFADFKKEHSHIDTLRQRAPIKTQVANVDD